VRYRVSRGASVETYDEGTSHCGLQYQFATPETNVDDNVITLYAGKSEWKSQSLA